MSTLTSTLRYSGTLPSTQPQRMRLPGNARSPLAETRASAATHLATKLESVVSEDPEQFYEDHVLAIYMGIFIETAMGPLLGFMAVYLYSRWIM